MAKAVKRRLSDEKKTFDQDCQWFADHETELLDQYGGLFVAILGAKVVDSGSDFEKLARRVYAKHGYRDLLISKVGEKARPLRGPGPRVASISG